MLSQAQLNEIRQHLESSQNPLFFFDNDADGLCSFLILRRTLERGIGIQIKTYPDLSKQYFKKVEELNPDAIFVLDKPDISKEFLEKVKQKNIPIIWIDHHKSNTAQEIKNQTFYYNTLPSAEPITYVSQKIFNRKQDLWIAMIGCIADVYMPEFAKEFEEKNSDLFNSNQTAFESLHTSEIGKFVNMLNFGLMDTTTNVVKLIKYLTKINSPYELLEENFNTHEFHKRYNKLNNELSKLLSKAQKTKQTNPKIIFFEYSGQTSMSSALANKLYFENPNKIIIVAYIREAKINLSIRGKNALEITQKMIKGIDGATGGGHQEATGAMIPNDKLDEFKERIREM